LTKNEALLLRDILLNIVKEEGHRSASFLRQLLDGILETIDAARLCDWHFHLLTYLEEVLETTFCLVAQFYAGSVWQLESLQVLVKIEKVGEILLAEGLNHVPGVVFRDGDAI
jgi:hypothetical protein